jgi:hypothetical protein
VLEQFVKFKVFAVDDEIENSANKCRVHERNCTSLILVMFDTIHLRIEATEKGTCLIQ